MTIREAHDGELTVYSLTPEQRAFAAKYRANCGPGILVEVTEASYERYGDYPPYTYGTPEQVAEMLKDRGYYERSGVYIHTIDVYDDGGARGYGAGRKRVFGEPGKYDRARCTDEQAEQGRAWAAYELGNLNALIRACTGRKSNLAKLSDFEQEMLVGKRFLADTWKDHVHEVAGQVGSLHTFSFAGDTQYTFSRPWRVEIWAETMAFIAAVPEDVERVFQAKREEDRAQSAKYKTPSGGPARFVSIAAEDLHPMSDLLRPDPTELN